MFLSRRITAKNRLLYVPLSPTWAMKLGMTRKNLHSDQNPLSMSSINLFSPRGAQDGRVLQH